MTTIVDGTNGISFPVTAGGTSATQNSSSKVLQVVQGTSSTQITTTSGTPVTTGITASITPSSSNSKILVLANVQGVWISGNNNGANFYLYRNSSSVQTFGAAYFYYNQPLASASTVYLDSPATTSSTTYTVYFAEYTGSNTVYINNNAPLSTITLMEIGQ